MKRCIFFVFMLIFGVILLGGGYLGWRAWQRANAPVFAFSQQAEPGGQFSNSILSAGDLRYVSTRAEFSLEPEPAWFGSRLVGRTTDGLELWAVPGNPHYVWLTGFMFPAVVYRNENILPIDLRRLPVEEMRYFGSVAGQRVDKSTQDASVIAEAVERLQSAPVELPAGRQFCSLKLRSSALPGLVYSAYVVLDPSGHVYLAPLYDDQHGAPAGPLFKEWIDTSTGES